MASSPPEEQPQLPPLHYTTWVLKVSIHCPGCKRKVKRVLQSIEGVYTTDIDAQQQKVIVTGNVEAETLIKKLVRNGRSAELWPEPKPLVKVKKPKKNENSDDDDEQEDDEDNNNEKTAQNCEANMKNGPPKHGVRFGAVETFTVDVKEVRQDERLPEHVGVVERFPAAEKKAGGGGGGGGQGAKKKKKKKKKSGNNSVNANAGSNVAPPSSESEVAKMGPNQVMDQANPGHSFQHPNSNPYDHNPPTYYVPQQNYVVSYNAAHPTISSAPQYYYIPSSPYMQYDIYSKQSTPMDSFEILSDENPHACYIM